MSSLRVWDSLLSLEVRADGSPLLTSSGAAALARVLSFSPEFVVTFDEGSRLFSVQLQSTTNLGHGALAFSIDGTTDGESLHHTQAVPDPNGTPGFMSVAYANKLEVLQAWLLDLVEDDPFTASFGSSVSIFPGTGTLSLPDINLVPGPVPAVIVINQSGGNKNIVAAGGWLIGGISPYPMADNTLRIFVPDALSPKWAVFVPAAF